MDLLPVQQTKLTHCLQALLFADSVEVHQDFLINSVHTRWLKVDDPSLLGDNSSVLGWTRCNSIVVGSFHLL